MKKIILSLILFTTASAFATTPVDAVRFFIEFEKNDTSKANYIPSENKVISPEISRVNKIYNNYKNSSLVNPYDVKISELPDSLYIPCDDFIYPLEGHYVTSRFGARGSRFHYGTDIDLHTGDTVCAPFSGRVRIATFGRGYGYYVVLRHENGLETLMAHFSSLLVHENDNVEAGQPIALGGSTGRSSGSHLHLEFRFLGNVFNPEKLIDFKTKSLKLTDGQFLLTKNGTFSHTNQLAQVKKAASSSNSRTSSKAYHKVRSGETLSYIARRYGTSVRRLCSLNHIRETSLLQIGQRIRYR